MDSEARLEAIAASILGRRPVDWSAVESTADLDEQIVLRQLRLLEEVTAVHRDLPGDGPPARAGARPDQRQPVMWAHLRLLEEVGRGSFGEVYRAWDTHLDREVALKLLRAAPTGTADASVTLSDPSRVVHEGRLLARVNHPNVITVYGAEPRDGTVGIWMEFIRGTTLHRLVEQQGRLGAREAAGIGADLCRALAAVHGAGLLHGDVTARNVMREDGGRVVLMDFGAGHDDQVSRDRANRVTGTPLYMAPELFAERRADHRTDVYALGTLLFYLVTGRYPVAGRSLDEVRTAHASNDRTRLRDLRADLPAAFVRPVEQALEPDPRRRFQSAGEMEAALESALPGRSPGRFPARWMVAAATATLVVTAAGAALLFRGRGDAPPAGQPAAAPVAFTARRIDPPPGVWLFSNPSDDGRLVLAGVNETGDAAVVDLSTGEVRPLGIGQSQDEGYASTGVLSPDGSLAAVDYQTERGGRLYVIRTDGSGPRLLVDAPTEALPYQWSRDGTMILVRLARPGQPVVAALVAASDGAVRVVGDLEGSTPTHMALSADNRYIAYDAPERSASIDRDIFILDAHTGNRWPLERSPGGDMSPLWTPDGRGVVFLSDRNRSPSLWFAPLTQGRLEGEPRLVKDAVGRLLLRGFTAAGALHYHQSAGFAEVFVATLEGTAASRAAPLSPRRAVSNFFPKWSPDGRFVAYAAERSDLGSTRPARELWVYDASTATEARVPFAPSIALPLGWSGDSREVLVRASGALHLVDRETGRSRLAFAIGSGQGPASWGPAGILLPQDGQLVLVDATTGRRVRTIGPASDHTASPDGRSVISRRANGRIALVDPATGARREWNDAAEWVGLHFVAPHTAGVAYVAGRRGVNGEARTLMYWGGAGDPRELMRVEGRDQFVLVGWLPDARTVLVARWEDRPNRLPGEPDPATLWRVPIAGGGPMSTNLTMNGLRDVSINSDGLRIAFNAGWRRYEPWVMEHLLPDQAGRSRPR